MAKENWINKKSMRKRILVIIGISITLFIYLFIRLVYVMIIKGDNYKNQAVIQWNNNVTVSAKRGSILDREGNELAVSVDVYRVDVDLKSLRESLERENMKMTEVSSAVAGILGMDKDEVNKMMTAKLPNGDPVNNIILKRRIEKEIADKIQDYQKKNGLIGFIISPDTKRYYTNNNFASHVLGHTNSDGEGLTGVELYYNKYLSGVPGIKIDELDAFDENIPYETVDYTQPVDGRDVILTLDENIQLFTEKAAQKALDDNSAKAVSIIVMNPNTGEILGMSNKPDYNPNAPWDGDLNSEELQQLWRNRAVNDAFEPGSIFKVITSIAALETGTAHPGDVFQCNGSLTIDNETIHCWDRNGHGPLTFEQIMEQSCNVGFMELGAKMGKETLYKYIEQFGFGKKTGIDLPGEAIGIVKTPEQISNVDLATISFGQTNTVTIMQFMQAFNSIVNGGKLITPHVMKEIAHYDESGNKIVDQNYKATVTDNGVKKESLDEIKKQLESTVEANGGTSAYVKEYKTGGKTGTAEKAGNGGYAAGKYVSSYVGMMPVDDPQVTILISVDEPDSSAYYASQTAAPIGKMLFEELGNYLALNPSYSSNKAGTGKDVIVPEGRGLKQSEGIDLIKASGLNYKLDGEGEYITDILPKPGHTLSEGTEIIVKLGKLNNVDKMVEVPNLANYSETETNEILNKLGLKGEFEGTGIVKSQNIAKGKVVNKGTVIKCTLEK